MNWWAFVDRYKDWGRDLTLYLGRKQCGLKLAELGILVGGIDYATVSNRRRRFEAVQSEDQELKSLVEQTLKYLEKGKMGDPISRGILHYGITIHVCESMVVRLCSTIERPKTPFNRGYPLSTVTS
jgi:hypothetical protein